MAIATTKKYRGASAIIRDGVTKGQSDSIIRARVKKSFPKYRAFDRVIQWAHARPDWCAGKYTPGKKNGRAKR